jgi:hypothetical protein
LHPIAARSTVNFRRRSTLNLRRHRHLLLAHLKGLTFGIGTDNQAFFADVLRPPLCCARFISGLMAFGAKQLDIFWLLAPQGIVVQVV